MPHAPALQTYLKQAMDMHQAGAVDRAMQMYREVLDQDPKQADALHLLGAAEWQKGNLEEAEKLMRQSIAVWDKSASYFSDLAGVLNQKGEYAESIIEYKKALKLDPNHRLAKDGLTNCYGRYGFQLAKDYRWEEAEAAYNNLLQLRPDDTSALNNLAEMLQHAGDRKRAIAIFDRALEIKPDHPVAGYNRAICRLTMNQLAEGWADLDSTKHEWPQRLDKRRDLSWPRLPLWDGSDLRGKTILVWGDQGIGDEVLFASMFPDLLERGAKIFLECNPRLAPLFRRSFPEIKVIPRETPPSRELAAAFDFQVPGLWLGRWLRPDFASFPKRTSYIKADEEKTAKLRARYEAFGKKTITGIAWHSSSGGRAMHRRMSLMQLLSALPLEDTLYVDLQYGDREAEYTEAQRDVPGFHFYHDPEIDQMQDMDSFASQIKACDNIVSIGNTTAHMAGALGVPGKIFLPIASLTWYWFEDRSESPWYPSLKLLRKKREGDWSEALAQVRDL